ncbi:MAG: Na/Pi cotransporter family protein [Akkermansiaceae bacterium]|nr:Na/Pi cotransporter family protein [Akkermansiaceae bacterium]
MTLLATTSTTVSVIVGLLQVLGALGVFLFGMKIMSEAVQRVAGKRMRTALSGLTTNRFSGVFTGFLTTSLVQSSSATTVLVVSFVNAGLLTLIQSIGVIMGANLGTTITAWIVAIVGKFSVSKIALPMIGVGLPFVFIGKDKAKSYGEMLLGFGLVFFGLGLLKDSVPDVRTLMGEDPNMAATIEGIVTWMGGRGFVSVLLYLVGGVALTLLVQSSSAAMAITITCALNGWLGDVSADPIGVFQNSAAIVLGENIGTRVTAWLAALGANVHAKRAARAHFAFNMLGVAWMLVAFYPFTRLCWHLAEMLPASLREVNDKMASFDVAFATAIFHSMFNLANIALLVAFVPQIARFVEWWIRDPKPGAGADRIRYISQGLVDLGELNIAEAENASRRMAQLTTEMFNGFVEVLEHPDVDLSARVVELKRMEDACDEMLNDITSYLIQCSTREIGKGNAARIASMLRVVSEFEEATDRIYRLVKLVQRKYEKGICFDPLHDEEIGRLCREVRLILEISNRSLLGVAPGLLEEANRLEDCIDALRKSHNRGSVKRMQEGRDVPTEMIYTEINNHLEAVGNHALNIVQNGEIVGAS